MALAQRAKYSLESENTEIRTAYIPSGYSVARTTDYIQLVTA